MTSSGMKKTLGIATLALSLAIRSALVSAAEAPTAVAASTAPAQLNLQLFDDQLPAGGLAIRIDDSAAGESNEDGAALLDVAPGSHLLTVLRDGKEVLRVQLDLVADENAQVIATLYPDDPLSAPSVFIESSHADNAAAATDTVAADGPPGRIAGRVLSVEDGKPVAGARVYVSGTPLDIVTDAEGRYEATLPPGDYSISVIAPQFSSQTIDGIAVAAEAEVSRDVELTPAGLELPEFVVLEPFVEGSLAAFVEEKRTSSAVTDILGAEQISRNGDSDAAGALKRVTGLTLVDGKFIYVRGLGERYSSTLLNGAQIPSPDPTRRVVPLDLFPTEILSGIVVQKTYSADMPAEFGGGTIQLRTRGVPESFLLKVGATIGYNDGTTWQDGLRYDGGSQDWTGFDRGTRAAPDGLLDPTLTRDATELEQLGESLAAQGYTIQPENIGLDNGFAAAIGDDFKFADDSWRLGYIAAFRYSQSWDSRTEQRYEYGIGGGQLNISEDYQTEQTQRELDASAFLSAGLEVGEHHRVTATWMQLRQTNDETANDTGLQSSGNVERNSTLQWIENALQTRQLDGEHSFPGLHDLLFKWQYTDSAASRYAPNRRQYRFTYNEVAEQFEFEFYNEQRFSQLDDNAKEARIDLEMPFAFGEEASVKLMTGGTRLRRDRDSVIRRFTFLGRLPRGVTDLEDLFNPDFIGPDRNRDLRLQDRTLPTDSYTASQKLDAWYVATDASYGDWRLNVGVRQEQMLQEVVTVKPFDPDATPVVGRIDATDLLPAGTLTWAYSDNAQLRLAYSRTVSRPDIREQSPSDFIDPLQNIRVQGNPDLQQADIESLDLRWEYYFSSTESISVAFFQKDFTRPIELVGVPASGDLLQIRNADSAVNRGVELDAYKSLGFASSWSFLPGFMKSLPWNDVYVGANYAYIDSTIDLGDSQGIQTNAARPLQGQSPYVANFSLAYLHPEGNIEATLLYNVFGQRIFKVGVNGLPDVYEQPFGQLDFTLSAKLPWDGWKLKTKFKNLLDPEQRFTVGELPYRSYHKGREFSLSVEWKF